MTGALLTALVLGLRHGVDVDHLAAITDVTSGLVTRRRGLALASCYAIGHALVVLALGAAAVAFGQRLPAGLDAVMGRVVGATLVALAAVLLVALVRDRGSVRLRSRWMLVADVARRIAGRLAGRRPEVVVIEHEHAHDHDGRHPHVHPAPAGDARVRTQHRHRHHHVLTLPAGGPAAGPGRAGAFVIGMVHGVGAETPTQVLLFVTAAGATGAAAGLVLLGVFVAGLLASNTVVAVAATVGAHRLQPGSPATIALTAVTAACSVAVGVPLLLASA